MLSLDLMIRQNGTTTKHTPIWNAHIAAAHRGKERQFDGSYVMAHE